MPSNGGDIQTLSTNAASTGLDRQGLLYVPVLNKTDPCVNTTGVPLNATRLASFPSTDLNFIALAPWVSANCTRSYLAAAQADQVAAFLFYLPNVDLHNQTAAAPPPPDSSSWRLDDNDSWKSQNQFPVYAINANIGDLVMTQLSYYSGNMTDAPYGGELTKLYDPRNYVRLYCDVDTGPSGSELPSLWVFLLVVLGMLLAVIGVSSASMHLLQRRRRNHLRQLIVSGQVDLEALGVRKLKVPQDVLDKLPMFIYVASDESKQNSDRGKSTTDEDRSSHNKELSTIPDLGTPTPGVTSLPHRSISIHQPSCSICLDDFISHETIVRSLPCGHIYHPACIDIVLREHSSLCPICKRPVLPPGFCPTEVTNAMVRRERALRRAPTMVVTPFAASRLGDFPAHPRERPINDFNTTFSRRFRRPQRAGATSRQNRPVERPVSVELVSNPQVPHEGSQSMRPPGISRQEWAQRRANILYGNAGNNRDEVTAQEADRPRCKNAAPTIPSRAP